MEALINYFKNAQQKRASGNMLTVQRLVYRGALPRLDRSQGKLISYSKDLYYPLDRQTTPGVLQVYATKCGVSSEALSSYELLAHSFRTIQLITIG